MKSNKKTNQFPIVIPNGSEVKDWNEWLDFVESELFSMGYRKYKQNIKNEDFAYWKNFENYQVGVFFYDFRKYQNAFNVPERIGVQFECMLTNINSRVDLSVSKEITIEEFENISNSFYIGMKKHFL